MMLKQIAGLMIVGAVLLVMLAVGCADESTTGHTAKNTPVATITAQPGTEQESAATSTPTNTPAAEPTPADSSASAGTSLGEYLTLLDCASFQSEEEPETYADLSDSFGEVRDRMSGLVPPDELAEWHSTRLAFLETIKNTVDEYPGGDEIDPFVFLALVEASESQEVKIKEIVSRMPDDVRQRLIEAGCEDDVEEGAEEADVGDHGDEFENATPAAIGEGIRGSLGRADRDAFVFHAEAGRSYVVELSEYAFISFGDKTGPLVSVYDSVGQQLAASEDLSLAGLPWRAEATGRYYVVLGDGASQGDYTITVKGSSEGGSPDDHGNDFDSATFLSVGEAIGSVIEYDGDLDMFRFTAEGGQLYRIDVEIGTLVDSEVALLDSDGWLLEYSEAVGESNAERIVWEAPESGDYYVEVSGASTFSTGSYIFSVVR